MMESWPIVAWVLLLTSIADWLKTAQSRDFTMKDIIFLHPSSDGRMDSPVFCAQYCTYTAMENDSKKIIFITNIDKCETQRNLVVMEKEGFMRAFDTLCQELNVTEVCTDAHSQISALFTTPHPDAFKCFTCEDAPDNYECNRWAPDTYCPKDTSYCYSLHMMDIQGDSVSVTKRCVTLDACLATGCTEVNVDGYQVCSSCCEGNICNLWVPRNRSSAVFSTTSPLVSSSQRPARGLLPGSLSSVLIALLTATHI